jgi:asparagine N-glycosylation enzyme membrane subunit Stt3
MKRVCLIATVPATVCLILLLAVFAGIARAASAIASAVAYLIVNLILWQDSATLLKILSTTQNKQHTQRNTNEPTRQDPQKLND